MRYGHAMSRRSFWWLPSLGCLLACGGRTGMTGAADAGVMNHDATVDATVDATMDAPTPDVAIDDAGGPDTFTLPPPLDAGTTFTFEDAGADAACSCHYHGVEPQGACSPVGLLCGPPYGCGGGCGEQACTCGDAGMWWCVPVPPC
jgi:hypothetical protein